jgi:hypothetical protein
VVGRVLRLLRLRRGHPALQPVEAQAGFLVLLPLALPLLMSWTPNICQIESK